MIFVKNKLYSIIFFMFCVNTNVPRQCLFKIFINNSCSACSLFGTHRGKYMSCHCRYMVLFMSSMVLFMSSIWFFSWALYSSFHELYIVLFMSSMVLFMSYMILFMSYMVLFMSSSFFLWEHLTFFTKNVFHRNL